MAEYRFDVPQTIDTFTEGLPTGLYQKILELDRPHSYEQWKQAAIDCQQTYIHMKARLQAHRGGSAPTTTTRMGADPTTHKPKCYGYLSWKNKGKNHRK